MFTFVCFCCFYLRLRHHFVVVVVVVVVGLIMTFLVIVILQHEILRLQHELEIAEQVTKLLKPACYRFKTFPRLLLV